MEFSDFKIRFNLAVHDLKENRPIKDELAAFATAKKHGLCLTDRFPPKIIIHQLILASLRSEMQDDAAEVAYLGLIPWWKRPFIRM